MAAPEKLSAQDYQAKTTRSQDLYQRAREVFPSGVTHDTRYLRPHPISVARAQGAHKWDVDGNEYIDYFGGHGALLLGHNHPVVVEAVREQLEKGTHYGGSHELELEWAELIVDMIPCAEKVRFTSSGTEASLLGMRVARAFTGKDKILRFEGHFHGWHDQVAFGAKEHAGGSLPAGIPPGLEQHIVLCPPNDLDQLAALLAHRDDIAAVLIEPTGATFGRVPTRGEFLLQLRKLTEERGILLIFDEVISGFRVAPGGAQEHFGVRSDLAFLAKVLAGGYPGGALVGRAEIMDVMGLKNDPQWNAEHQVSHYGTFNANPISASAGLAALKMVASTDVVQRANRNGALLRDALNQVIKEAGLNWTAYGEFSEFHIFANRENRDIGLEDIRAGRVHPALFKEGTPAPLTHKIRTGLMTQGVDVMPWPGGLVSAVHSSADIERTAAAFKAMLAAGI